MSNTMEVDDVPLDEYPSDDFPCDIPLAPVERGDRKKWKKYTKVLVLKLDQAIRWYNKHYARLRRGSGGSPTDSWTSYDSISAISDNASGHHAGGEHVGSPIQSLVGIGVLPFGVPPPNYSVGTVNANQDHQDDGDDDDELVENAEEEAVFSQMDRDADAAIKVILVNNLKQSLDIAYRVGLRLMAAFEEREAACFDNFAKGKLSDMEHAVFCIRFSTWEPPTHPRFARVRARALKLINLYMQKGHRPRGWQGLTAEQAEDAGLLTIVIKQFSAYHRDAVRLWTDGPNASKFAMADYIFILSYEGFLVIPFAWVEMLLTKVKPSCQFVFFDNRNNMRRRHGVRQLVRSFTDFDYLMSLPLDSTVRLNISSYDNRFLRRRAHVLETRVHGSGRNGEIEFYRAMGGRAESDESILDVDANFSQQSRRFLRDERSRVLLDDARARGLALPLETRTASVPSGSGSRRVTT